VRKEHLEKENCQGDLQQENCLDGRIKDMTKNIGKDWKGIGDGGKKSDQRKKKMKTIAEEEEIIEENSGVREWTEDNDDKMGNMMDPYYEL